MYLSSLQINYVCPDKHLLSFVENCQYFTAYCSMSAFQNESVETFDIIVTYHTLYLRYRTGSKFKILISWLLAIHENEPCMILSCTAQAIKFSTDPKNINP